MCRLALLLVLSVAVFVCEAKLRSSAVRIGANPGFVIRLRESAYNSFFKSCADLSSTYMHKLPIPDADALIGGVKMCTKNIRITKFPPPEVRVRTTPPNGFAASFRIPHLGFEGPFTAERSVVLTTQKDGGRMAFNVSDVYVNVTFTIGEYDNGVPKVENFKCASSMGNANLNVKECKAQYALDVMTMAAKTVRPGFNAAVCSTIERMIGNQLNTLLGKLPNSIDVSKHISFKFLVKPNVGKDYLETRLHLKTFTDIVSPYTPTPFVEADNSNHMVSLFISDALINDALYQAHQNNLLSLAISPDSQPILYDLCRVSCAPGSSACLGNVAPDLKTKFGHDASTRVHFKVSKTPEVQFKQGKATFTAAMLTDLFVTTANDSKEYHEATAVVDVTGNVQIKIKDGAIFGMVTVENVTVHIDEEHNKKWEDKIGGTIKKIVEQHVNGDLLLKGCPLKLPFGAELEEPHVSFQPGTLQVGTSFAYKPVASAERK